jgi:arsenate reductase
MCQASDREVSVRLYLNEPLSKKEISGILSRLNGPISRIIRTKDSKFKTVDSTMLNFEQVESIADFLFLHGHLMERPLLDDGTTAIIGRPVENLNQLL